MKLKGWDLWHAMHNLPLRVCTSSAEDHTDFSGSTLEHLPSISKVGLPGQLPLPPPKLVPKDIKVDPLQSIQPQTRAHRGHVDTERILNVSQILTSRRPRIPRISTLGIVLVLEPMPHVLPPAEVLDHRPRRDEVVARPRRDLEHGVLQAVGPGSRAEHVLLAQSRPRHDVQRQHHGALPRPRALLRDRGPEAGVVGVAAGRGREREQGQAAQDGGDAHRLADVRGDVVGRERAQRQRLQGQVQQRRVRVLGVPLQGVQGGVRAVVEVLLPRRDDAREPALGQAGAAGGALRQILQGRREEDGDGLLGRCALERASDVVPPELKAERADLGRRYRVCYPRDLEVEGSDCEVGGLGATGNERQQCVRRRVIFPKEVLVTSRGAMAVLTSADQSSRLLPLAPPRRCCTLAGTLRVEFCPY